MGYETLLTYWVNGVFKIIYTKKVLFFALRINSVVK